MRRGGWSVLIASLISLLALGWLLMPSRAGNAHSSGVPDGDLSKWATVEARDSGVPVYAFGHTYVFGVSPDFRPGVVLQQGNDAPAKKI